jgi:hypothetical protein
VTKPDLRDVIETLVDWWLATPQPGHSEKLHQVVQQIGALPVPFDWNATHFLRPDGEILVLDDESKEGPQVEHDGRCRLCALVQAASKYPELRPLLPARPEGTPDCKDCGGAGSFRVVAGGKEFRAGCGACCGLGWVGAVV